MRADNAVSGFPSPAEQYVEPPLDINTYLIKRPEATFLMQVEGDAMQGAAILDGDVVAVDRSLRPADGDVIVAAVDGAFVVRRFMKDAEGVRLESANSSCPGVLLRKGRRLDYFGKVIGVVRKLG